MCYKFTNTLCTKILKLSLSNKTKFITFATLKKMDFVRSQHTTLQIYHNFF